MALNILLFTCCLKKVWWYPKVDIFIDETLFEAFANEYSLLCYKFCVRLDERFLHSSSFDMMFHFHLHNKLNFKQGLHFITMSSIIELCVSHWHYFLFAFLFIFKKLYVILLVYSFFRGMTASQNIQNCISTPFALRVSRF